MKKPKNYGYCRVSTKTQDIEKQKYTLLNYANTNKFQFTDIFEVVTSSKKSTKEREIDSLLEIAQEGDCIYTVKLDRLGRNTSEVLQIIEEIKNKKIILHIIQDNLIVNPIDTNPITIMYLTLLSAFAQMERDFISERTKIGLAAAKAKALKNGEKFGKQKGAISNKTQFEPFKEKIYEYLELGLSYEKIVKHIGVGSKSSLYSFVENRKNIDIK